MKTALRRPAVLPPLAAGSRQQILTTAEIQVPGGVAPYAATATRAVGGLGTPREPACSTTPVAGALNNSKKNTWRGSQAVSGMFFASRCSGDKVKSDSVCKIPLVGFAAC